MYKSILIRSSLAVSAAGLCLAMPAYSQTSSVADAPELEEIIVTARRVEERLQDVPISIQVFSQQSLSNNNVTNAVDLGNITPSLSVNNNYGNENASFAIRGFVQDAGTAPSVGTYFGDVVVPRGPTQGTQAGDSAGPGSFYDLQNVQVLKGPQGTLQGRNTTGGAVLLVPQKPTARDEAFIEVSKGNYDMTRVQAAINAPLSDAVRFRIAADHQTRNGWIKNRSGIGADAFNDVHYNAVRASLVVDVTPNLENYTIVSYSKSDTNGAIDKLVAADPTGLNATTQGAAFAALGNLIGLMSAGQLAAQTAQGYGFYDVSTAITNPQSMVEQQQIINTTTWHVSDGLTLKNIASYAEFKDYQAAQLFETNWNIRNLPAVYGQAPLFTNGLPAIFTGIFPAPGTYTANQNTYTEELQAQGTALDQKLSYQAGVYLEWSDPLAPVGNQSSSLLECSNLAALNCTDVLDTSGAQPAGSVNYTVGETVYRDKGLYTQESYSFTDKLKLTAGARYTWDKQTNTAVRKTNIFFVPNVPYLGGLCTDQSTYPTCAATYEVKSSKPTWLIDLDYKVTDDMLLYGKYARGYRAGGITTNAPIDHRTFQPEQVDNFELGTKSQWRGAVPVLFNLAVFYNNFTNQQIQIGYNAVGPVSPTTGILNAGKSRIYGAEMELSISPIVGLNFDLNYTYLNATIQEIGDISTSDPNYVVGAAIAEGSMLALSPKNKAVLSVAYTLPLDKSIGSVVLGGTVAYTSQQQSNYAYQVPLTIERVGGDYGKIASRTLLNLNLGWKSIFGSNVDLTAFGTNVTNKQYYSYFPGLGSAGVHAEWGLLGEPRMFGVRAAYHFGG
jgi:iron complex outermembrane receptor protein